LKQKTVRDIIHAEQRATEKHGPMSTKPGIQMSILIEELGEAGEQVQNNDAKRYREEILDLIAAAVRVYETV